MTTTLQIPVPNIGTVLASYDVVRVYRAPTRDGPFAEATASTGQAASLVGTVAGPFTSLNGKTLICRVQTPAGPQPDVSVTFSDANPVSILQVIAACTALGPQVTASNDGSDHLKLATLQTGKGVTLKIVGGTGLQDLGLGLYAAAQGQDPFIALVAGQTQYTFVDPSGTDANWYRWNFFNTGTFAGSALTAAVQASHPSVDPVRKIEDFRASRGLTLVRGRPSTFRMAFWEDAGQQVALQPLDAGRYPAYSIVDPNGLVVQTGKADLDGQAPNYKVEFTPAVDALLTNDDRRWRIDWWMVTDLNRNVQASELFDLRDVDVTESAIKEQKYLLMDGQSKWFRYAVDRRPTSLSLQIENANQPTTKILPLPAVWPPSGPNPSLQEIEDGDRYVYAYEVPSGMFVSGVTGQTYQAIWTLRETPLSEEHLDFQIIETVPRQVLQYMTALKMGIDKFQKQQNMLQAYQPSDTYEYLVRGLQWVNGLPPVHLQWQITSVPAIVQPYWLLAAAWWGLNAQQGLEIDLSFTHCVDERTLVRTTRGLTRISQLFEFTPHKMAAEKLVKPADVDVFATMHAAQLLGKYHTRDIIELCSVKTDPRSLGSLFAKYNLNVHRETDHKGGWLWDVQSFWQSLARYGLTFNEDIEHAFKNHEFDAFSAGETKPAIGVWRNGVEDVLRVENELGYTIRATKEHGFLVLDADSLLPTWKKAKDLLEGDTIAMDVSPESDDSWDVDLPDVRDLNAPGAIKTDHTLPTKLTPELARILGFLVSEGAVAQYNSLSFGNTDPALLDQYSADFEKCFGLVPSKFTSSNQNVGYRKSDGVYPEMTYLNVMRAEPRRFLAACGLDYTTARKKSIPWCILQAPRHLVAEYLHAHFDGDGNVGQNEYAFASFSRTFREQLQTLLLRFGIVSRNDNVYKRVTIRGPSALLYEKLIGFGHKKGAIQLTKFYTQREAIPESLLVRFKTLRDLIPAINCKGWVESDTSEKKSRVTIMWDHNDHYAKHATWKHVAAWWDDAGPDIRKYAPALAERIEFLLDTKFLWVPVKTIKNIGARSVYDVSLAGGPGILDHGVTMNGFVTHNSGQSVTLEYNHADVLAGWADRMKTAMQETFPPLKTQLYRKNSPVGSYAGRSMRRVGIQNFVFPIARDTGGVNANAGNSFLSLMTQIGLI